MTKPNILFLIIDSLRADKFHGERKTSVTPNIDSLIKNGTYFQQAVSSSASTILALSTILTGLYPFKTGLGGETYHKLNSTVTSYVKILRDHGYNAYATAPEVASDFGLVCDFQNPESAYDNYFSLFAGLGDQIIEYFSSNKLKTPWFFYIHLFDLHSPVVVPKEFDDGKFGKSNYEKQVSAIDSWIGKIVERIDFKNTLLIITSDHGTHTMVVDEDGKNINLEVNGEFQMLTTKFSNKIPKPLEPMKKRMFFWLEGIRKKKKMELIKNKHLKPNQKRQLVIQRGDTDEHTHIPLLFVGYGVAKGKNIVQQVRSIDIFPTICDLLDIKNENEVDGVSLKPLLNSTPMKEIPAYIQSTPMVQVKSDNVIGIRTSKYKYFRDENDAGKRVHLFDLTVDPLEDNNIANVNLHVVEEMERIIEEIHGDYEDIHYNEISEDDTAEIEKELKKLGYD